MPEGANRASKWARCQGSSQLPHVRSITSRMVARWSANRNSRSEAWADLSSKAGTSAGMSQG